MTGCISLLTSFFPLKRFKFDTIIQYYYFIIGGAVASWTARSTPDRVVWVQALAGVKVLCS